jgi:hypothetical protein
MEHEEPREPRAVALSEEEPTKPGAAANGDCRPGEGCFELPTHSTLGCRCPRQHEAHRCVVGAGGAAPILAQNTLSPNSAPTHSGQARTAVQELTETLRSGVNGTVWEAIHQSVARMLVGVGGRLTIEAKPGGRSGVEPSIYVQMPSQRGIPIRHPPISPFPYPLAMTVTDHRGARRVGRGVGFVEKIPLFTCAPFGSI